MSGCCNNNSIGFIIHMPYQQMFNATLKAFMPHCTIDLSISSTPFFSSISYVFSSCWKFLRRTMSFAMAVRVGMTNVVSQPTRGPASQRQRSGRKRQYLRPIGQGNLQRIKVLPDWFFRKLSNFKWLFRLRNKLKAAHTKTMGESKSPWEDIVGPREITDTIEC